jgi:Mn-dependent DtxR family transcriptional regulator
MRTTLTLDAQLVERVVEVSAAKTKTRAVTMALEEYVRRSRIHRLRALLGKVDVDPRGFSRLRELEIAEAKSHYGRRSH